MMVKTKFPDTSDAERWLNDGTFDTFVFQGKLYKLTHDFKVIRVKDKKTASKVVADKMRK